MNENENRESVVRISLIDVLYGVVLGYGFYFFDQADTMVSYIRFFFAYAVIIVDWIYVHRLYWGWEYKYNSFLVIDIFTLFFLSRLVRTATTSGGSDPNYWLWISALFITYFVWDIVSKWKRLPSEHDKRYSMVGDLVAATIFVLFYAYSLQSTILFNVVAIIIYLIAVLTWFKKIPQPSVK